jgi:hypothetical protein
LVGKFVLEHFTPLTLDVQTGVVSDEDTDEIWETSKKETIASEKVRGNKNRSGGQIHLWEMIERRKNPSDSADQTVGW